MLNRARFGRTCDRLGGEKTGVAVDFLANPLVRADVRAYVGFMTNAELNQVNDIAARYGARFEQCEDGPVATDALDPRKATKLAKDLRAAGIACHVQQVGMALDVWITLGGE